MAGAPKENNVSVNSFLSLSLVLFCSLDLIRILKYKNKRLKSSTTFANDTELAAKIPLIQMDVGDVLNVCADSMVSVGHLNESKVGPSFLLNYKSGTSVSRHVQRSFQKNIQNKPQKTTDSLDEL